MQIKQSVLLCCLLGWLLTGVAQAQVANVLSSVGAANRGAATAMPLDASNAQDWNPGSITDLPATELDLNIQPSFPHIDLNASIPTSGVLLNDGSPRLGLAGGVSDGNRFNLTPSIGFVKKTKGPWAFGFLGSAIYGSGVRYPVTKFPLTASPPRGFGSGQIKEDGDLYYIAPTVAYRFSEHWSVGIQPNIVVSSLEASPFASAEPDDADHDGIPSYPRANKAWSIGAGIKGGVYFRHRDLRLGVSLKSPTWFTPYRFKGKDEVDNPRHFKAQIDGPMILSMGVGYSGIPRTKLALDVRQVNYETTQGFDEVGFNKNGAQKGLGWRNVWAYVGSVHYELTEKCFLRLAYAYSLNPIRPEFTSFSIASPALVTHQFSVAVAYRFRPNMLLAVSYQKGFPNSSQGPINRPEGPIPGSNIKVTSSLDSVAASLIFLFK